LLKGLGQPVSDEEIFFDVEKLDAEPEWEKAIERARSESELFIFLVSMNSLGSDYCVRKELATAVKRGVDIVPVLLSPWDDWKNHPIHDPDTGDLLAVLGKFHSAGLPKDSGNCKAVSAWPSEQAAWDAVRGGLKPFLLKCFGPGTSPPATAAEPDSQADLAPDSGSELQQMLADRLNTSWSELAALPEFCGSEVFSGLSKPLTPRVVFEACCGAPVPEDFLCDLGWMASDQGKTPSTLRLLRENHVYRDTVKLMTLVGGEAFVIRGDHEVTLNKYEPLDGDDPRIVAVLAAACMGFGLKLSPGLPEPVNFLRLPVEEFGHRQGLELAEDEIAATVRRKLHLKAAQLQFSSGTGLTEGSSSKSVVKARLRTLLNELKFRLVIVAPDGSPMRDEDRARTVLEDFNVPTLFKGVPRAAVRDLMEDLSGLIAPLLDGTLSVPDQGKAPNDA
jgi:hypothetical protein